MSRRDFTSTVLEVLEGRAATAKEIAHYYGQGREVKSGDGYLTFCPCHDNRNTPSLSIRDTRDGDVEVFCHGAGCDFRSIKDRFRQDGLLPEWQPNHSNQHKNKASPKDTTVQAEKASYPWRMSSKEGLVHAKQYLAGRAITMELPLCFRWTSYRDRETGKQANAIVAAASKQGDTTVYAVQRLFIDLETHKKTGAKMHGPCKGRGVWLDCIGDLSELIIGEGIETTLSAMQALGINGVAALSTSGMKALEIPEPTETIYVLVDSDPERENEAASMPGQTAAYITAQQFEASRPGRKAFLISPDDTCFSEDPAKIDFNDLLKADPSGASIRERFDKKQQISELEWKPMNCGRVSDCKGISFSNPMQIFKRYAVTDDYVNSIGREEFLYPNLIIKNHILVIVAESGSGKTTLLFYEVASKISRNGYITLYFDADSPPSDHPKMKRHADEHGFKHLIPDLNQGTSLGTLLADLQEMADGQANLSNYVMFFDTLKKFTNLMSKEGAKDFFVLMRKLTKLGATIVLPGHANKHRDGEGNLIFEGVGDVKSDCDDMILFERNKKPDGSLDVTTICDSDHGAKVRGLFKPFSFNISKERAVTFYDKPLEVVDLSHTGTPKATDAEILDVAEQYLKNRKEPVIQQELVDYSCDAVKGAAGKERVRKLIVQRSLMKSAFTPKEGLPFGARFIFTTGDRNKRLYELPPAPPKQQPIFGEDF